MVSTASRTPQHLQDASCRIKATSNFAPFSSAAIPNPTEDEDRNKWHETAANVALDLHAMTHTWDKARNALDMSVDENLRALAYSMASQRVQERIAEHVSLASQFERAAGVSGTRRNVHGRGRPRRRAAEPSTPYSSDYTDGEGDQGQSPGKMSASGIVAPSTDGVEQEQDDCGPAPLEEFDMQAALASSNITEVKGYLRLLHGLAAQQETMLDELYEESLRMSQNNNKLSLKVVKQRKELSDMRNAYILAVEYQPVEVRGPRAASASGVVPALPASTTATAAAQDGAETTELVVQKSGEVDQPSHAASNGGHMDHFKSSSNEGPQLQQLEVLQDLVPLTTGEMKDDKNVSAAAAALQDGPPMTSNGLSSTSDAQGAGEGRVSITVQQGQPDRGHRISLENGLSMDGNGVGVVGMVDDVALPGPPPLQLHNGPSPQGIAAREESSSSAASSSLAHLMAPPTKRPGHRELSPGYNPYRSVEPTLSPAAGRGGGAWAAGLRSNPFGGGAAGGGPFGGAATGPFGGGSGAGSESAAESLVARATMTASSLATDTGSGGGSNGTGCGDSVSSFVDRFDAGGVLPSAAGEKEDAVNAARSATMTAAVAVDDGGDVCSEGHVSGGEEAEVAAEVAGVGEAGMGNAEGFGAPAPWESEEDDYFAGGV